MAALSWLDVMTAAASRTAGADTRPDPGAGARADPGALARADAGAFTGPDSGTLAGARARTGPGAVAGSGAGARTGVSTGAFAGFRSLEQDRSLLGGNLVGHGHNGAGKQQDAEGKNQRCPASAPTSGRGSAGSPARPEIRQMTIPIDPDSLHREPPSCCSIL